MAWITLEATRCVAWNLQRSPDQQQALPGRPCRPVTIRQSVRVYDLYRLAAHRIRGSSGGHGRRGC
jgi:hypothetical protein